ncbi:hypothetical protein V6X73_09255 [Spiribacter sp. 390]|uniref:HK97 gp10 family phage protein n=1 Tax=Spiribacter pallidus TaxID=1987936 RepID=A0ABV3TE30_9GAMM
MADLNDFIKNIPEYNEGIDNIAKKTVLKLSQKIVERTPVGNPDLWDSAPPPGYVGGRARNNWFPSFGEPSNESTEATADESVNRVLAILNQVPGNVFYLTNNLPYIRRLEYDGWSTQAPRGMVRVTLREAQQEIKKAARQNPDIR